MSEVYEIAPNEDGRRVMTAAQIRERETWNRAVTSTSLRRRRVAALASTNGHGPVPQPKPAE